MAAALRSLAPQPGIFAQKTVGGILVRTAFPKLGFCHFRNFFYFKELGFDLFRKFPNADIFKELEHPQEAASAKWQKSSLVFVKSALAEVRPEILRTAKSQSNRFS